MNIIGAESFIKKRFMTKSRLFDKWIMNIVFYVCFYHLWWIKMSIWTCMYVCWLQLETFLTLSRTVLARSASSKDVRDHLIRRVFGIREDFLFGVMEVCRALYREIRLTTTRDRHIFVIGSWRKRWRGVCTTDVTAQRLLSWNDSRPLSDDGDRWLRCCVVCHFNSNLSCH